MPNTSIARIRCSTPLRTNKVRTYFTLFALSLGAISASPASAEVRVKNARELKSALGLNDYHSSLHRAKDLKIAILDNDFEGLAQNLDSLPSGTQYIRGPLNAPSASVEAGHGLLMAQVVWNLLKERGEKAPQFYLIQANGFTNFTAAVDSAIEKNVDVILYAATWETASNYDGRGFLNAVVNKATAKGITWINAAGNNHRSVFSSNIDVDSESGLVKLPGANDTLTFSVKYTNTPVKLTLSWNDYKDYENHQTLKDLDFEIRSWTGQVIRARTFAQGPETKCEAAPRYSQGARQASLHPREQDTVVLDEGVYHLRIIDCSGNFNAASDKLKVIVQSTKPGAVELDQAQGFYEVTPPADNPNVITVGDRSPVSSLGPTFDGRVKPDLLLPSIKLEMSDGRIFQGGSSIAAAAFTAVYGTMWSRQPKLKRSHVMKYLERFSRRVDERGQRRSYTTHGPMWFTPSPWELDALVW